MRAERAATGRYTTDGFPRGHTSLTPHLVVTPADRALDFYASIFGAAVGEVTRMGGLVAHAELAFPQGRCTLGEPMAGFGLAAPTPGAVTYSLGLYVADVDEVVACAVAAGAILHEPVATFVSGDRYGSIVDPFGVRWSIRTRVEDLSPEESAARVAAWAAQQSAS